MRFAYIDSNGNEIPIPSVDALALRIELGAISEDTELYDAQADQWGPAHTHEIFHSLSRASGTEDGFVAPPPVGPAPAEPAVAAEVPTPEAPVAEEASDAPADALSLGLSLADPIPDAPAREEASDPGGGDLVLEPEPSQGSVGSGPAEAEPVALSDDPAEKEGVGGFDFGDMGGGLELEATFDGPDEPAMDFFGGGTDAGLGGADAPSGFEGGMNLEQSMELEQPLAFGSSGFDAGSGGSLDLEAPMSEFRPEDPPAWMEGEETGAGDGDVMDFSSVSSDPEAEGATTDGQQGERRTPRSKPSPPKHRRQPAPVGAIVGVTTLLVIGVGGYVAWPAISAMLAGSDEPVVAEVVLPDIPAALMPQMRSAAQSTYATIFEDVRDGAGSANSVTSPSSDWLAGIYLANASDFSVVEDFWLGVEGVLEEVQSIDLATFDEVYRAELAGLEVGAADAAIVRERADSGFVASSGARTTVFDKVQTLVDAALDLHEFLAANQASIEYVPAATITTDPVLEASPRTPEIRAAMENLIDQVTDALADLNYFDLVTGDGLWSTVLSQVQAVGVR